MLSVSLEQISAAADSFLQLKQKSSEVVLNEVRPPDSATSTSLVFASNKSLFNKAVSNKARAFILTESVYAEVKNDLNNSMTVWTTHNIQAAMAKTLGLFDENKAFTANGIHPTASIHATAKIGQRVHIGAYAVIEAHAEVGDDTIILPHVYVGPRCRIGKRCRISSHVTIGSDGFGFYTDKFKKHHKIPQIGKVVIEDDCEIGSHCAIDRATLTETRIKQGSKFDNFCHIAHNVQVGENALIAAGFIVAGSTIIGNNLMTSGGVHVLGHLKIADDVILTARAGVVQSVELSGMYGGYPLEPHRESTKTLMSIPHLKTLRKQMNKVLKHLNLNSDSES